MNLNHIHKRKNTLISKIKCHFVKHEWGTIIGLDPAKDSGLYQTTTKYCMYCDHVDSIVYKPAEIQGEESQMTVLNECADISDEQWEKMKEYVDEK